MKTSVDRLWRRVPDLKRAWFGFAVYNLTLGGLLALGGMPRVQGPSFALVRDVGGPIAWGAVFAVGGAAIAFSAMFTPRTIAYALLVGAVVHGWFAAQFLVTAFTDMRGALTGPPTYLFVAILHALVAIAYKAEDK